MINVTSLIKSQINKIRRIRLTKKLVNLRNTKTFFSQQNFNDKIIHFRKGLIYQTKNVRQGRDLNFERQQTNWLVNQKQMWISSKAQVIVFMGSIKDSIRKMYRNWIFYISKIKVLIEHAPSPSRYALHSWMPRKHKYYHLLSIGN